MWDIVKAVLMSNRVRGDFSMSKEMMEAVAAVIIGQVFYYKGKKRKIKSAEILDQQGVADLILTF
jgi:hypothetical protein